MNTDNYLGLFRENTYQKKYFEILADTCWHCERCLATGKRGYPLGIFYFYEGDKDWPEDCLTIGPDAERGCVGCGWYNIEAWLATLNQTLNQYEGGGEDRPDN